MNVLRLLVETLISTSDSVVTLLQDTGYWKRSSLLKCTHSASSSRRARDWLNPHEYQTACTLCPLLQTREGFSLSQESRTWTNKENELVSSKAVDFLSDY